ncbi:MAG: DUF4058 family protein [Cyanobacteria bacterium J06623_5]
MPAVPSFPGMNPYLESPHRWPEMHTWLIVELARAINPQLLPKYRAAVETRVYIDTTPVGIPDASIYRQESQSNLSNKKTVATVITPERVTVPMPWEVSERYLEIREVSTQKVITVIEVLSPANKRTGEGRTKYIEKRQKVLGSATHFVEIDLLRKGKPMPIECSQPADYQILVSRANERPSAERYAFNLREPVPQFLLPLTNEDAEPIVDLKSLLETVCQDTGIAIGIDYTVQPQPTLSTEDFAWVQSL